MKLLHALHIYSTVFAKCMRLHFSRQCSNKLWVIQLRVCGQIISVFNSERIIKIGQYLPKLCSNEKGSSFFWLTVYNLNLLSKFPKGGSKSGRSWLWLWIGVNAINMIVVAVVSLWCRFAVSFSRCLLSGCGCRYDVSVFYVCLCRDVICPFRQLEAFV